MNMALLRYLYAFSVLKWELVRYSYACGLCSQTVLQQLIQ